MVMQEYMERLTHAERAREGKRNPQFSPPFLSRRRVVWMVIRIVRLFRAAWLGWISVLMLSNLMEWGESLRGVVRDRGMLSEPRVVSELTECCHS